MKTTKLTAIAIAITRKIRISRTEIRRIYLLNTMFFHSPVKCIPVNAQIHTIGGFSAHADREELLAWHGRTGSPECTFLVHGEEDVMSAFSRQLHGTRVERQEGVVHVVLGQRLRRRLVDLCHPVGVIEDDLHHLVDEALRQVRVGDAEVPHRHRVLRLLSVGVGAGPP